MAPSRLLTSPAAWSVSGVSSVPASLESWRRFTVWAVTLNGLVKPRLGSRRYIGIWPPSKPGLVLPPARALDPLWPLPEVLPSPEPTPRPTRLRVRWEPGAGRKFDNEIFFSVIVRSPLTRDSGLRGADGGEKPPLSASRYPFPSALCRRNFDQVPHLGNHPPHRRVVR